VKYLPDTAPLQGLKWAAGTDAVPGMAEVLEIVWDMEIKVGFKPYIIPPLFICFNQLIFQI
jgi:hypothetical protein